MAKSASSGAGKSWLRRFLLALPAAAGLVLTFFFFSPLETVLSNGASFQFSAMGVVAPVMGLFSLCAIVAGAAVLSLFRGRLYGVLVAVCLAFALCLYAQGTFLSGSTPQLSGESVNWTRMKGEMLVNTAVWAVLFSIPFILLHFRGVWKFACVILPLAMCVMQLSGVVSLMLKPEALDQDDGCLTFEGFCDYSAEGNVLVFMVDRMDYQYIEAIEQETPDFFARLDGFTCYDNAISQFAHTRPAMNFMLTNYDVTMFREEADDFYLHSWDDGERHILKDLKAGGYDIDLYALTRYMLGKNFEGFTPYVSNLKMGTGYINKARLILQMSMLSAYRNFPLTMKPFFYTTTSRINTVYNRNTMYMPDESAYDKRMAKMTSASEAKRFKFYEFNGAHAPYRLNADGKASGGTTSAVTQAKGCFEILLRAFNRMKEAGIYRDTAIIILADHGYMYSDYAPLEYPTRIAMFYKPAGEEGTPLQRSYAPVSLRNVPATILKAAGLDSSAYGVPLDEVPDDESVVRDYIRTIADKKLGWKDCYALYYDVQYDASKLENWTLDHTENIEYPLGF